nr:hypothetical protein [Rhodococcus opacus]
MATQPGSVADPSGLKGVPGPWYPVQVPGTAAGAILATDGAAAARATKTDAVDWWFVTDVSGGGPGPWRLEFDGLASHAQVWAGDDLVLSSESMFVPAPVVRLGDLSVDATIGGSGPGAQQVRTHLRVPDVRLWWPHTHGTPRRIR